MFDERMRQVKDSIFRRIVLGLRLQRIRPLWFTSIGLLLGLGTAVALWRQWVWIAAFGWAFNRIFDAFDGVVARQVGRQSDLGGYMDILADFVVYAAVPIGLVAGWPSQTGWLLLALLLASFYVNAASWMYLAAILEKRRQRHPGQQTTIVMPAGLVGGVETIIFFSLFILLPAYYPYLFGLMALLVLVTVGQRLLWAARHLPS